MYSHANMYGQPAFGSPAFHQPPVNNFYASSSSQYQQQQYLPPPPPVPQHPTMYYDPNAFRKNYMNQLAGLTFNSRPIIQSLSMLAQEYSRYAEIVVNCVETHIRKVPPTMKLPAFYLLDAISKNVYEPYARTFASIVAPLFLHTYSQVDGQIRSKMEEMLLTWRKGSPTNQELFGSVAQLAIERGVWGDGRNVSITKSQVLSELQFAIGHQERTLQLNPYDNDAPRKLEVLHQLCRLITDVGVSQDELRQILGQLRDLVKGSGAPPPPAPPPTSWPPASSHYPQSRPQSSQSYPGPGPSGFPSIPFAPAPAPPIPSSSVVPSIPNAENIAKILDSLKTAGVLVKPAPPSSNQVPEPAQEASTSYENTNSLREYRSSILSQSSILSSSDILRTKPNVSLFVYDRLPSQCKQCGVRFADTAYGRKKMDEHLDVHFVQNKRFNQNTGRGHSRAPFVDAENWIRDGGQEKGKAREQRDRASNAVPVKTEQELRSMYVVVPAGDEAKNVSCPICKEHMKSEFLEDDEEWVWRNAVLKDDKIYHATCHVEAITSSSGIAARLRTDASGSSRSGTPDMGSNSRSIPPPPVPSSKSPSPDSKSTALKRKVESDAEENTGTPPLKKIALSVDS